jgi:hypothetical protein
VRPIAAAAAVNPRPLAGIARRGALARAHGGTVRELYQLLASGGRWWLVPMLVVLAVTSALLVVVAAIEYVAPFVYTVF